MIFRPALPFFCALLAVCGLSPRAKADPSILVSVPDQKLVLLDNGLRVAQYRVSTSRFGLGDSVRSYATPLGALAVAAKVGADAPEGAVFKSRRFTGEVLRPNAPGRDPIVTRILHLRGLEAQNARAYGRGIYIHGTPQEKLLGRPASFGCIRMRSCDVVKLFNAVPVGARVQIVNSPVSRALHDMAEAAHKVSGGGAS
ncbi:L,D-transpeptidase family protein [Verrucomicrobiota bacterium sgz303538]